MNQWQRVSIPGSIRAVVWEYTNGSCWYCGALCNPFGDNDLGFKLGWVIDHAVPLCRGGNNDLDNLVPCCSHCNSIKGTKTIGEWREHNNNLPSTDALYVYNEEWNGGFASDYHPRWEEDRGYIIDEYTRFAMKKWMVAGQ